MIIAAADVGVHDQIFRQILEGEVIDLQIALRLLLKCCAVALAHLPIAFLIHNHAPGAVIKLDVPAARRIEIEVHSVIGRRKVAEQFFLVGIKLTGNSRIVLTEELCEGLRRSGQGLLCNRVLVLKLLHEEKVLYDRMVLAADFSRHTAGTVRGLLALKIITVIQLDLLDAVEPPHEIEVPVAPAELAVRNHMVAECLLLLD